MNLPIPHVDTVYAYDQQKMNDALFRVVVENTTADEREWLNQKKAHVNNAVALAVAFMQLPRKVKRSAIVLKEEDSTLFGSLANGFTVRGWTADRLCRVWLLLQLNAADKDDYTHKIQNLFEAAEMHEQVALYSALPLLAYPQYWQQRCSEGIRSNIGDVLEAIMCRNPYPSTYLKEPAWNQMVLKAFFTEKPVQEIIGLDERADPELANILIDYAHERWAAHRSVNPQLWRCVGKFIDEKNFSDIERVFHSQSSVEKAAAALACYDSSYGPANVLLKENSLLKQAIETGRLAWHSLG